MPCLRRACSIEEEYKAAGGEVLLDNDDDEGWLATHGFDRGIQRSSNYLECCKNLLVNLLTLVTHFWDDYEEDWSGG